jgi:hypothetical protein
MMTAHALPLLILVAACSSRIAPPPAPNGTWSVSLTVGQSARRPEVLGKQVSGTVRIQSQVSGMSDKPVGQFGYYGTFDIDFRPIGGWLVGTSDTSSVLSICPNTLVVAAARADWKDSVHVVLNPCTDHGRVVFDGKWNGAEVVGRWYESTDGGSVGTFRMRRAT